MQNEEVGKPYLKTATGNVVPKHARLTGVFCSSSTSGTLTLYDSATTGTTSKVVDTFNLTAGSWYFLPFEFSAGIYAVISGTASVTFSAQPAI